MPKSICKLLTLAIYLAAVILVILLAVMPAAISTAIRFDLIQAADVTIGWLDTIQSIQIWAMSFACYAWIFFVGGCFASFLNVVAWRVPRGKSILGSSHCPQCKVRLSFRNNLPILGWLRNAGSCASCDSPIPARYLITETVLGSIFLLLFATETVSGGATLPFRVPNVPPGIENLFLQRPTDLLVILAFHLTLISIVFTLCIVATEKFSAPASILVIGIIAAFGFQMATPAPGIADYRLTGFSETQPDMLYLESDLWNFLIATLVSSFAAMFCWMAIEASRPTNSSGLFGSVLLIGLFLGWQSVLSITIIYFLFAFLGRLNACSKLLLAMLIHLMLWRFQSDFSFWPGPMSDYPQLLLGVAYIIVGVTISRSNRLGQNSSPRSEENLPIADANLK